MKISPNNVAEAIYGATVGKSGILLAQTLGSAAQMIKNRRMLGKSEEVLRALQDILDKETGTIRVKVTTAKNMENGEKKKIENEIKEKYNAKSVISEFFRKEELLGGMRIQVGDEVLDASYKNKLQKLENFLMQEK